MCVINASRHSFTTCGTRTENHVEEKEPVLWGDGRAAYTRRDNNEDQKNGRSCPLQDGLQIRGHRKMLHDSEHQIACLFQTASWVLYLEKVIGHYRCVPNGVTQQERTGRRVNQTRPLIGYNS